MIRRQSPSGEVIRSWELNVPYATIVTGSPAVVVPWMVDLATAQLFLVLRATFNTAMTVTINVFDLAAGFGTPIAGPFLVDSTNGFANTLIEIPFNDIPDDVGINGPRVALIVTLEGTLDEGAILDDVSLILLAKGHETEPPFIRTLS
jgi:hypothetical protein